MSGIRKATMSDVAREAGVSLSTVDRVLNGRGSVAPDKAGRILAAARRLKLDRSLAQRPSRILRIAVLIQPPSNPFHAAMRQGIDLAARLHGDLNLQFLVHHVDPNDTARIAALIRAQAARCDGMIVTSPDDPLIAAALREASGRIPVVTLADDIAGSGRAAYVGPDDRRAGRIAGDLMGRLLGPDGGHVAMILGLAGLRGHREREVGFRSVLAEFHPETRLTAVFESREDPERAGLIVQRALRDDPQLRGIYLCTTGSRAVVGSLRRLGRSDTVLIVHELTDNRRALLRERAIDAVIDQNPALEAQLAVETMARLLGRLEGDPVTVFTDIRIYMPENA
jgi:LacI family transcriptional regulator